MNLISRAWIVTIMALSISGVSQAQGLQRGNLIGIHVITVTLNPNATMDDFKNFYVREVLPEYEKNWPGLKGYLLKSFFSDAQNKFAIVWLFKTEEHRNRNFNADGSPNELEKAALEKVKPIEEKLKKLYGAYTIKYTHDDDWVVQ